MAFEKRKDALSDRIDQLLDEVRGSRAHEDVVPEIAPVSCRTTCR